MISSFVQQKEGKRFPDERLAIVLCAPTQVRGLAYFTCIGALHEIAYAQLTLLEG